MDKICQSKRSSASGIKQECSNIKVKGAVLIWPMLRRYLRFGIVGASGVAVDMAVLFVLSDPRMFGLNLSLGKVLAAEIALLSNFILNELWTFGDISAGQSNWRARLGRLIKFNLICAAGIGLSILLLNIQVRLISMNVYIGNLIAIVIVSLWNFGMNLKFGWNKAVNIEPLKIQNQALSDSNLT
jgi:dolichol-phosphate mannosyltransferase